MTSRPEAPVKTSVLVVDDSAFMRTALSRMINSDPALFVVGTACCGREALEKIPVLNPDVITLDVEMPGLDGLGTLRCIRARFPRPVIMVSSATVADAKTTFDALGAGAFDYVPKHLSSTSLDIIHIRHELIAKLKAAANSHPRLDLARDRKPPQSTAAAEDFPVNPAIVAIGTSTGGPQALEAILTQLPADFSVPVLIVQHMPPGFTKPFAQRLNTVCAVRVQEASHREPLRSGVVYIAPAGQHMIVERPSNTLALINLTHEPVNSLHIPSVDVMMKSIAAEFQNLAMGVILTGMGSDGAQGMTAIQRAGGITIGQDESSCVVYGMPRACAELGILQRVVPLSQVSQHILQATHYRKLA
ncbi:MAG: chemotaxis response regulator protein-glutamate methylesterase [Candidatus Sulfotelmatobacter sp.]